MVAQAGLENFRTRDVADRAGINSATLHHYFPTKEALVEAVASHLEHLYQDLHRAAAAEVRVPSALMALRQEFADARFCRDERPEMLAVSSEFVLQATRDRTAARAIAALHQHWRHQIEGVVRDGQATGDFLPHIDAAAASMIIVGSLWSATALLRASSQEFEGLCAALEAWLTGCAATDPGEPQHG